MRMSELKGCYALLMKLKNDTVIEVGALGPLHFPSGHYLYIGSAQNGIEGRVRRHLRKEKKLHWHIDYFLKRANVSALYYKETKRSLECQLAEKLSKRFEVVPLFGSSDCKCKGHLFYGIYEEFMDSVSKMGMRKLSLPEKNKVLFFLFFPYFFTLLFFLLFHNPFLCKVYRSNWY